MDIRPLRERLEAAADLAVRARVQRDALLDRLAAAMAAGLPASEPQDDDDARERGASFDTGEPASARLIWREEERSASQALIAADGSQILPDRHRPVAWAVARAAAVCMVYGHPDHTRLGPAIAGQATVRFWSEEELVAAGRDGELLSAAEINAERDLMEREHLAAACEAAHAAGLRPVALVDGTLLPFSLLNDGLWRGTAERRAWETLQRVIAALDRMKAAGAIVAGYIERPNSRAVVGATSAAAGITPTELPPSLVDRALYQRVLSPGQRGGRFSPAWRVNEPARLGGAGHAIQAFYGWPPGAGRPDLVRVEAPAWALADGGIEILTSVLARQIRLGAGYPFILKAAHEEAVLTRSDQADVDGALMSALARRGITPAASAKLSAKELQ